MAESLAQRLNLSMETVKEKIDESKDKSLVIYRASALTIFFYFIKKDLAKKLKIETYDVLCRKEYVYFSTPIDTFPKVKLLRSIDNVNLLIDIVKLNFTGNKQEDLNEISSAFSDIDIFGFIQMWAQMTQFAGLLVSQPPLKYDFEYAYKDELQEYYQKNLLRFRVTCTRNGNHSFNSVEAAARFGGVIVDKYHWFVSVDQYNLNILFDIEDDYATLCLQIPKEQSENRFMYELNRTSLSPSIAYTMLCIAKLQPGYSVVDPICDCGFIAMECLFAFPNVTLTIGDFNNKQTSALILKLLYEYINLPRPIVFDWEEKKLPLADNSVDAIVSYLPFKKREYRKTKEMYKNLNREFSRVVKRKTGRIVILTKDTRNFFRAFHFVKDKCNWDLKEFKEFNARNSEHTLIVGKRK